MSLKGIELQIAIPKTFEAGKMAEQKQQRAQLMQDQANLQTEKQAEKDKETVLETNHYEKIKDDPSSNEHQQNEQQERESEQQKTKMDKNSKHPYKGSFVDYSG